MDKEIALAFYFDKAPPALRQAAEKRRDLGEKVSTAREQSKFWANEFVESQRSYREAVREFDANLSQWDIINDKGAVVIVLGDPKSISIGG